MEKLTKPVRQIMGRMIAPIIIQTRPSDSPVITEFLGNLGLESRPLDFGMVSATIPTDLFRTLTKLDEVVRIFKDYPVAIPEATVGETFGFMGTRPPVLGGLMQGDSLMARIRNLTEMVSEKKGTWVGTKESGLFLGVQDAHDNGITGTGYKIAVIDTDSSIRFQRHPQLGGRVIGHSVRGFTGFASSDTNGHGGHVTTIAIGSEFVSPLGIPTLGMAPGATGIGVKTLFTPSGTGMASDIIEGIRYAVDQDAHIINLSLGAPPQGSEDEDPITVAISQLPQHIIVCVASGNDGPSPGSVDSPGISSKVLTVGAWDTRTQSLPDFSSRGPNPSGLVKPDFVMPGVNIYSGITPRTVMDRVGDLVSEGFGPLSGTSMATPHMTGMVTLIKQWFMEDFSMQVTTDTIRKIGQSFGKSKDNNTGHGILSWPMVQRFAQLNLGAKAVVPT